MQGRATELGLQGNSDMARTLQGNAPGATTHTAPASSTCINATTPTTFCVAPQPTGARTSFSVQQQGPAELRDASRATESRPKPRRPQRSLQARDSPERERHLNPGKPLAASTAVRAGCRRCHGGAAQQQQQRRCCTPPPPSCAPSPPRSRRCAWARVRAAQPVVG